MKRSLTLTPLFFLLTLYIISPAQGANEIDFNSFPTQIADKLSISLFPAQILLSGVIMLMFLLPIALITRKRNTQGAIPEVAMTLVIMGFCIALGWLPFWFLLVLSMLIALMFSTRVRDAITGR